MVELVDLMEEHLEITIIQIVGQLLEEMEQTKLLATVVELEVVEVVLTVVLEELYILFLVGVIVRVLELVVTEVTME